MVIPSLHSTLLYNKYSLGSTISIFTTIEAQTVVEPIVEPHRRASTILLQLLFTTIEAL